LGDLFAMPQTGGPDRRAADLLRRCLGALGFYSLKQADFAPGY